MSDDDTPAVDAHADGTTAAQPTAEQAPAEQAPAVEPPAGQAAAVEPPAGQTAAAEMLAAPPALRIVSGSPTAEDVAVVTALVAAAGGDGDDAAPRVRRGGWSDPSALRSRPPLHGPNAWRSALR